MAQNNLIFQATTAFNCKCSDMQQKSGRWIAGSTADPNYLLEGPNGVGGRPIVPHKRELETRGQSCWQQTPCAHESVDMSL